MTNELHDSGSAPHGAKRVGPDAVLGELLAEYMDRYNAGESLDEDEIVSRYPECGAELVEHLRSLCQLGPVGKDLPSLGTLGDYTLRCQLGRGGMGVVYDAWQASMDRRVALKVLPLGIAADERAFQRFMREARTAGALNHPHVVHVHGLGIEEQTPYYAMLTGQSPRRFRLL